MRMIIICLCMAFLSNVSYAKSSVPAHQLYRTQTWASSSSDSTCSSKGSQFTIKQLFLSGAIVGSLCTDTPAETKEMLRSATPFQRGVYKTGVFFGKTKVVRNMVAGGVDGAMDAFRENYVKNYPQIQKSASINQGIVFKQAEKYSKNTLKKSFQGS